MAEDFKSLLALVARGVAVSLARIALPLAKKVGTSLLKKGARQAMSLAQDVAADVAAGKNIGQSLKEKGMSHLQQFGKRALKTGMKELGNSVSQKTSRKRKTGNRAIAKKAPPKKKRRKSNF